MSLYKIWLDIRHVHTSVILADKGAGDATDDARPSGLVILTGIQ